MEAKTLNEIHKQGIDALVKVLGPVDAVRFLQIYDQEAAMGPRKK